MADDRVFVMGLRGFPNVQGGVERHCEMLYPRLVGEGFKPVVFTRKGYQESGVRHYKGVDLLPLPVLRSAGIEAVTHTGLAVMRAKQAGAKLIHIHAIGPALWAGFAKRVGLRVVVTHHGFDYRRDKWGEAAKAILRRGEQSAIENADAIVAISGEIEDEMRARGAQGIVARIPNGVVRPRGVPSSEFLREWALEPGRYALLTARFVPEKRILDLMRGWARSGIGPGYRLAIAGGEDHPSPHGEEICALAAELGVVLTGMLSGERLASLYAHAGFFVLPSSHEGLPISLLEAMSWSLPVVASDIVANLEVGLDRSSYFPLGDLDALARAMAEKAANAGARCDYGALLSRYDWDRVASDTASLYRRVLDLPPERGWWGAKGRWRLPPLRGARKQPARISD